MKLKIVIALILIAGFAAAAPTAKARSSATAPCWSGDATLANLGASLDVSGNNINTLYANDSINAVDYTWSKVSGPGTITFGSVNGITTTVTFTAPGAYVIGLLVHDSMGASSTFNLTVGTLAYDKNGIVIQPNANADLIFDKMIAFGKNPACFEDWMHARMVFLQIANNTYWTNSASVWSTYGQGTVSYPLSGIGPVLPGASVCGTTSCNGSTVSSTDMSFWIHNSERLSLGTLPTWIVLGGLGQAGELIRICNAGATTGDALLTVCYDGRGISSYPYGNAGVTAAASHPNGEVVGEYRIHGTGTLFSTDSQRPLAPAGLPGPPGPVKYSTGSVAFSGAGLTTVTLSLGSWTSPTVQAGYMLRVSGTHGGGTPFVWWAIINSVNSTTTATVSRSWPSDADSATGLLYQVTGPRYIALEFADTALGDKGDGLCIAGDATKCGTHLFAVNLMGCERETDCYATTAFDMPPLNSDLETGMHYSYKNTQGDGNQPFATEFYSTSMGELSFFLRSGYTPAQTEAQLIGDYWINDPEFHGGYAHPYSPFYLNFGVIGAYASMMINPSSVMKPWNLRKWAIEGKTYFDANTTACNGGQYDTRDQSLLEAAVVLPAIFDLDSNYNGTWKSGVTSALTHDQNCKRADNSFGVSPFTTSPNIYITPVVLTHGSAIGIGTGFGTNGPSSICSGTDTGTIDVTNGSFSATLFSGTLGNMATNSHIAIYDTTSSPRYVGTFVFSFSGSAVILAGKWPGATGRFTFMVEDISHNGNGASTSIGIGDESDTDNIRLQETWACIRNSSTQITLIKPWDDYVTDGVDTAGTPKHLTGTNSGTYYLYASPDGVGGYYQQPFMFGIKTKIMNWAAKYVNDSTIKAGFDALLPGMGQWYHDVGFDTYTNGTYYSTLHNSCRPTVAPKSAADPPDTSTFFYINEVCGQDGLAGYPSSGEFQSRVNNAEAFPAVMAYYDAQCLLGKTQCDAARDFGDKVYFGIWGDCSMTAPGLFCDGHHISNLDGELTDTGPSGGLGSYKWPGFWFGMGMQHQWPAKRIPVHLTKSQQSGKSLDSGKTQN